MEKTNGLYSLLSRNSVYLFLQNLLRSNNTRPMFVNKFLQPFSGARILDIGCGPAFILEYMNDVAYYGFGMNQKYIEKAQQKSGSRGNFFARRSQKLWIK